jgi:hypothetical protein
MPDLIRALMIVQRGLPGQARIWQQFNNVRYQARDLKHSNCSAPGSFSVAAKSFGISGVNLSI